MSKRWQVALQSAVAIFIGVTALMAVSYDWPVSVVVFLMFLIGYSAARHFLHSYDERQTVLLSAIWGVVFAELGWLAYNCYYIRDVCVSQFSDYLIDREVKIYAKFWQTEEISLMVCWWCGGRRYAG